MEEGEYFTLGSNSGSVFDLKPDVDLLVEFPPLSSHSPNTLQISWTINALEIARNCGVCLYEFALWLTVQGETCLTHAETDSVGGEVITVSAINPTQRKSMTPNENTSIGIRGSCTNVYEKILNIRVHVFGKARKFKGRGGSKSGVLYMFLWKLENAKTNL